MLESYLGPSVYISSPHEFPFRFGLAAVHLQLPLPLFPPLLARPPSSTDLHDLVETTLADDLLVPNEKSSVFNRVRARSPQNSKGDPPYPLFPTTVHHVQGRVQYRVRRVEDYKTWRFRSSRGCVISQIKFSKDKILKNTRLERDREKERKSKYQKFIG